MRAKLIAPLLAFASPALAAAPAVCTAEILIGTFKGSGQYAWGSPCDLDGDYDVDYQDIQIFRALPEPDPVAAMYVETWRRQDDIRVYYLPYSDAVTKFDEWYATNPNDTETRIRFEGGQLSGQRTMEITQITVVPGGGPIQRAETEEETDE